MTSARWQTITRIFEDALDKHPNNRGQFVREACAGDSELESEVAKLLAADENAGSFLEGHALSTLPGRSNTNRQSPSLAPGSLISGRFEIVRFIGQGGMGQVYEALDLELKGKVALKTIREDISSDPRMLSRFRREVLLTRRITHPNVCRTFDIERHSSTVADGTSQEITFLTMELLEGETLADFLVRHHRLTSAEALPLVIQMINALSAAHTVGIVHRDFKPSNVLLVPTADRLRVVVTDFGLARAILPDGQISIEHGVTSLTDSKGIIGTLIYMAPEQFERGEVTIATDIYSLGLVMYEMVTGQRPFVDAIPFTEAIKRVKQAAPSARTLVPELDPGWETAISKCLEGQPKDRFESVVQVAENISNIVSSVSASGGHLFREAKKGLKKKTSIRHETKGSLRKSIYATAICLSVVSLFAFLLRHYQVKADSKLPDGATVLLTQIQNTTGDQRFDGTTELMRHQVLQSPYFSVMDTARIRDSLEEMKQPADSPLIPTTARGVALRNGVARVIFGTVSRVGDSYVLDIDIERPDNDTSHARAQWENHWTWNVSLGASEKEIPSGFLSAVRDASDWIRSEVGESANDIARANAPPRDVTTDNWPALLEFVQAEKFKADGRVEEAVIALHNAIAADPHFALAYTRLGDLLISLGRFDEAFSAYQSALAQEQQQRLTRRERDRLSGIYANDTDDFTTAEAAFRDYTAYYPHDYLGWFYRAHPLMMMGRVEEAIDTLRKAAQLNPASISAPAHIARFNLILGNFNEAAVWIQHLRDSDHSEEADRIEGQSEFLQDRYQEAQSRFAILKASHKPLNRSYAYSFLTRLFAELGQYQNALQQLKEGIAADLETGDDAGRADKLLDRAYLDYKLGQYHACSRDAKLALDLDRSLQRSLVASMILGQAVSEATGADKAQLALQLRVIESRLPRGDFKPLSDIVKFHLRGEVLLAEGKSTPALDQFRKADQIEAPNNDKAYLVRALLAVAQHSSNQAEAAELRDAALAAYSVLTAKPGFVWQWPQDYPPGYCSDISFAFARLAVRSAKSEGRGRQLLESYVRRRSQADPDLHDVQEAKKLWYQDNSN
jgi:eukaryotic-like serine/threonine-protein kinase